MDWWVNILDEYLKIHSLEQDVDSEKFRKFYSSGLEILKSANFLLFPKEKTVTKWDSDVVKNCVFKCDLVVFDNNFWSWYLEKEVLLNQTEHLKTFDTIKTFLQLQEPTIAIWSLRWKHWREEFLEQIRMWLLTGFEKVYWLSTWYKVPRIGFNIKDSKKFIFNNGILDIDTWKFEKWNYSLIQDTSINLDFPTWKVEWLDLDQSLKDCLSIEKYISKEKTISSIVLWYMIAWIFRKEYKDKYNEFPFLWIQWYSWIWKTSLLNFLSWISWYNWNTINGVCDSDYAFEVWMDCMWWRFYYFDEIQKASSKLLKYIQAAYNSWENHKWWANWNRSELQVYRKDCSLICTWEQLPQQEEALLNRFIILCPCEPFAVKKWVTDIDEFEKYKSISDKNAKIDTEYLTTDQIKTIATNYYRPRFLNILKNKKNIDFNSYHEKALKIIESFSSKDIDARFLNNLSPAVAWYMLLKWESLDEEEIKNIIKDYLDRYDKYRKDSIVSWRIVQYIISHVWEFSSWINKVKWTSPTYPMIYLKWSDREQWIVIQIQSLIKYVKDKVESNLSTKHIEQQFRQLIWIWEKWKDSWPVKVAKWLFNINWVFISYDKVKTNDSLKMIRDYVLDYYNEHLDELRHRAVWDKHSPDSRLNQKSMSTESLKKLMLEMEYTYDRAPLFDNESFKKYPDTESL